MPRFCQGSLLILLIQTFIATCKFAVFIYLFATLTNTCQDQHSNLAFKTNSAETKHHWHTPCNFLKQLGASLEGKQHWVCINWREQFVKSKHPGDLF